MARGPVVPDGIRKQMVADYVTGMTTRQVARKYGVTQPCVHNFVSDADVSRGLQEARRASLAYPINEKFFSEITTEAQAWCLGWLATDGCNSGKQMILSLQKRDRDVLEKFKKAMQGGPPLHEQKIHPTGKIGAKGQIVFAVGSVAMCKDLVNLGIMPCKTWIVCPWEGPSELLSHYWRGCIEGDGTIFNGKQAYVGFVGNHQMVDGFSKYVASAIGCRPPSVSKVFSIWKSALTGLSQIKEFLHVLYDDADWYMDRKKAKADALFARFPKVDLREDLTAESLLEMLDACGTWGEVSRFLDMSPSNLTALKKKRGVPASAGQQKSWIHRRLCGG